MLNSPLCFIVGIYLYYVLLARIIISFVLMFKPGWAPPSGLRPILDLIYAITDPPVNALRKVVPQPYNFPLDLSFLVWFIIVLLAHNVICGAGV
ncbi:MAG TPA: YggT family protein [Actinomycetota bacterium]|nr:YggT family protein [Actinomycetota bacterium]